MRLPSTTSVGVIHCGINNIRGFRSSNFSPNELALDVISCGVKLSELNPQISIIIMGILPTEGSFPGEASRISDVNQVLSKICEIHGLDFVNSSEQFLMVI